MGISIDQIVGDLGKANCTCSICTDLFEDAVTLIECEHTFCRACLTEWVESKNDGHGRCPECRAEFSPDEGVKEPTRFMRNMLADIQLNCSFEACEAIVSYTEFYDHQRDCAFHPEAKVTCMFCDEKLVRKNTQTHRDGCINYVKYKMSELQIKTTSLETKLIKLQEERHVDETAEEWDFKKILTKPGIELAAFRSTTNRKIPV